MGLGSFLIELRRRRVFRAAGIYIVGAWVAVQVISLILPAVDIPDSALRYVWLIAILLFPLVILFAWSYDLSAAGITRTPPASDVEGLRSLAATDRLSDHRRTRRRRRRYHAADVLPRRGGRSATVSGAALLGCRAALRQPKRQPRRAVLHIRHASVADRKPVPRQAAPRHIAIRRRCNTATMRSSYPPSLGSSGLPGSSRPRSCATGIE